MGFGYRFFGVVVSHILTNNSGMSWDTINGLYNNIQTIYNQQYGSWVCLKMIYPAPNDHVTGGNENITSYNHLI
jgi:hypothetical protein